MTTPKQEKQLDYIIEREFEYAGYKCVVVFRDSGHRCGYVGIPETHPLYKKSYSSYLNIKKSDIEGREVSGIFPLFLAMLDEDERVKIDAYFQCHGGITYSEGGKGHKYPIESDLWWFGFDCSHAGDKKDLQLAYEKFPSKRERLKKIMEIDSKYPIGDDVIRTEEYVVGECKRLAEQLKEFETEVSK